MANPQLWGLSTSPLTISFWGWEEAETVAVTTIVSRYSVKGAHFHRSDLPLDLRVAVHSAKGLSRILPSDLEGSYRIMGRMERFANRKIGKGAIY